MRSHFIASCLIRKNAWRRVGGFPDYRAAEDRVFMESIEMKGLNVGYNPKASVAWSIPANPKGAWARFSNYSYHDLKAGRTRDWHLPVLKMYAMAAFFICLGFLVTPLFMLIPLAGFALRVIRKIIINRNERYFRIGEASLYFIFTGAAIFSIDMAMFTGWIKYIFRMRE